MTKSCCCVSRMSVRKHITRSTRSHWQRHYWPRWCISARSLCQGQLHFDIYGYKCSGKTSVVAMSMRLITCDSFNSAKRPRHDKVPEWYRCYLFSQWTSQARWAWKCTTAHVSRTRSYDDKDTGDRSSHITRAPCGRNTWRQSFAKHFYSIIYCGHR